MLNLSLPPTPQPSSGNVRNAVSPTTPTPPVSEQHQDQDQVFKNVLKDAEQGAAAAEQNDVTTESITTDEASVVISANSAIILSENVIINPVIPLASGRLSTTQPGINNFATQLKTKAPITEQSDFFISNPSSTKTLPPNWATNPVYSTSLKLSQSALAGTSLSNTDTGISTPASKLIEPLPYISMVVDNAAMLTDNGKVSPLSNSSMNPSLATETSVSMSTTLSNPAWPDEFGHKIKWMATQQLQTAELKLHPAHLGPIEVLLKITTEQGIQQLTAQFTSQNLLVRETIEANLPRLREIMAESGITLAGASVGADTPRQGGQNSQQTPAHPYPSSGSKDPSSTNIRHESGQMAISQMSIINTFA
ncbi:MAG: flagellar hook-length control protein FliK [Nitrosomonas sp.]